MKETIQLIQRDGKPDWAILTHKKYLELVEQAEMLQDVRNYDAAKADLESEKEELTTADVVFAILDGENPIKVWRNARGLTQQQVADAAGISKPYLSQIETGKRKGRTESLASIAKALKVSLDEIVDQKKKPGGK